MIPAVQTTAVHVQDRQPAPELLDGKKTGLYADASDLGIAKGPEWYEKPFRDTGGDQAGRPTLPLSGRQGAWGGEAESRWWPVHSKGLLDGYSLPVD